MKNRIVACSVLLVFVAGSLVVSAEVLDQVNVNISELNPKSSAAENNYLNGLYSYEEVIMTLSSIPIKSTIGEIEKAVSKMEPELIDTIVGHVKDLLVNDGVFNEATLTILVECESFEAADNLMRGVGRLILYELHNGLEGLRIPYNESLSESDVECNITGLRGVADIIDVLNDDFSSYAKLYNTDR